MPIKDREVRPDHTPFARFSLGLPPSKGQRGINTPYFIPRDHPQGLLSADEVAAEVEKHYGPEPVTLYINMLGTTMSEVLPAAYRRYKGGGLVMCRGDGETIDRAYDPIEDVEVVRNGRAVRNYSEWTGGYDTKKNEWDFQQEMPQVTGEEVFCPGSTGEPRYAKCMHCKLEMHFRFLLRKPNATNDMGWEQWVSTNYCDIRNNSPTNYDHLRGVIKQLQDAVEGSHFSLMNLNLELHKVEREMTFPNQEKGGKRTKTTQYMLQLRMPESMEQLMGQALFESAQRALLPAVVEGEVVEELVLPPIPESVDDFTKYAFDKWALQPKEFHNELAQLGMSLDSTEWADVWARIHEVWGD